MISRELMELRSHECIMESLHDIAMDLPAGERSKYVSIVTEAMINNPETQKKIITKLANQIDKIQQIDLEACKKSNGNITKYQYYHVMVDAMDIINESEFTTNLPSVIRMNKIHNILLDNCDDFVWGYKHNDFIVTKTYILLTRLLFITIDMSISEYVKAIEVNFKFNAALVDTPKKYIVLSRDADRVIKLFESGEWRNLMNASKRAATNRNIEAIDEMKASESLDIAEEFIIPTGGVGGAITAATTWFGGLTGVGKAVIAVGAICIVILLAYRHVAFFIARLGGRFADSFRHMAELIKAHDSANRSQSDSAVEKHSKLYNRLIGTADKIEAFFTKASKESDKDVSNANREEFSTNEITQMDFSF